MTSRFNVILLSREPFPILQKGSFGSFGKHFLPAFAASASPRLDNSHPLLALHKMASFKDIGSTHVQCSTIPSRLVIGRSRCIGSNQIYDIGDSLREGLQSTTMLCVSRWTGLPAVSPPSLLDLSTRTISWAIINTCRNRAKLYGTARSPSADAP